MCLYFYTGTCIAAVYGQREDIPTRTDPETGDRGAYCQPGGAAPPLVHAAATGDAGDALAGLAGIEAGENARGLSSGDGARGGSGADASAGARARRVFAGHP